VDELLTVRLDAAERRRRDERREENRRLWAAHYWSMATSYTKLARKCTEKAVYLEEDATAGVTS